MNHFDEMTGLLYLEGQLDAGHGQEIAAHAASCAGCRELLRSLELEGVWLREALSEDEEPVPARLVHLPERGGAPWGWIVALGLACGGGYTLWSGIIEPWRAQAAQAGFTQGNLLTMLFFSGAFWKGWDAMRSLMEFMAVTTLGIVVIWLFRRHWRHVPALAAVMGLLLCALAAPPSASAGEVHHGNPNYTLPAGQEVKTDLIVLADYTRIDGDIDGDLIVWSRSITVTGHVKGDILAGAQDLRLDGRVDGNARVFAQSFSLNGTVGKNVMSWTQDLDLGEKSRVGGTVTAGGDDLNLNGLVAGDGLLFGNAIDINGLMGGDLYMRAGSLTIGPSGEVKGLAKYEGRAQPIVSPNAKLANPLEIVIKKNSHRPDHASPRYYWHQVLLWGVRFLFGLAILLLVPGLFFDAGNACKRFGPAVGFGLLFICATPIVALIVCASIVGLGVGIATLLLYIIAVYSGQVFVGAWLGETILGTSHGVGPAIGRLALGLAIIRVLMMLPYAGGLVTIVAAIWGLGALVLALHRRLRPQWAVAHTGA